MLKENNPSDRHTAYKADIPVLSLIRIQIFFALNDEYFLQIIGTAMRTLMAPTYANIFICDSLSKLNKCFKMD